MALTNEEMNALEKRRFELLTPPDIQIIIDRYKLREATAWERKCVLFEYERRLNAKQS